MSPHDSDRSALEPGEGLRGFLRRGEAFIEEILRENETLRLRVLQLESKLQEAQSPVPTPVAAEELRAIFEQLRREHEELQRRLDEVAQETETYKARYREIEEENDRLVNLFVSSHQLHSTLDLAEAVQIVVEILLNFVGAGRFALLLHDSDSNTYRTLASYGLPAGVTPVYPPDRPPLADCLASGTVQVGALRAPDAWDLDAPAVLIPLTLNRAPIGAVAIYSFLEQKDALSPIDQELFALLAEQGGVVLESARLAASVRAEVNRYAECSRWMRAQEESHA